MPNSKCYANEVQAFVKALERAVDNNDPCEAARLVNAHTEVMDEFLTLKLMQLELDPNGTVH